VIYHCDNGGLEIGLNPHFSFGVLLWTEAGPETKKAWMPEGTPSLILAYRNFATRTVSAGVEPAAGSRGATYLDSADRRETVHFLPRHRQSKTPGLSKSIYDYRRIRALRAFSQRRSWT